MLRLALIFALLASIAVVGVSMLVTQPAVTKLSEDLKSTKDTLATTQAAKSKAEADARAAKANSDKIAKELSETKQELETASNEATMQHSRADKLNSELTKVTISKNKAEEEVAKWEATGIRPEAIRQLQVDLKSEKEAKAVANAENKVLNHKINNLEARLDRYEGDGTRVVEMPGLKGTVVAVDPKWNFVLLDTGANQGAKENGVVMVRRGDKLLAKARITRVEADRSYANLLADWTQGGSAVAVGDVVLY